jgi:Phage integrase family
MPIGTWFVTRRLTLGPAWRADGGPGIETSWIVTEQDGAVINPETILGRWRSVVRTAGVPAIPLHGARPSNAETALRAGARPDVVSRQLGHASISTTANIYLHDADDSASEAAELLASVRRALGELWGNSPQTERVPAKPTPPLNCALIRRGDRIRTCDLWVMSPASYRTAPPRRPMLANVA